MFTIFSVLSAEEDVTIIPGKSWADKTWSLVRNMFSPIREPRKTKVGVGEGGGCFPLPGEPRKTKVSVQVLGGGWGCFTSSRELKKTKVSAQVSGGGGSYLIIGIFFAGRALM